MTRRFWIVAVLMLACCNQVSAEDCERACVKPYELVKSAEQPRINAWKTMPAEMAKSSTTLTAAWQKKLRTEQQAYQAVCVDSCLRDATDKEIKCRVRARNIGEWKRCK